MEPITIYENSLASDYVKASVDYQGQICLEIEEPWSGDTDCNDRSGAITLSREKAELLAGWLLRAIANS